LVENHGVYNVTCNIGYVVPNASQHTMEEKPGNARSATNNIPKYA